MTLTVASHVVLSTQPQNTVEEEEGPEMRDRLREERTQWVTDQISADQFPDDLEAFYLMKNPPPAEPKAEEEPKKDGG